MYFTWFRPPHIFRQTVAPGTRPLIRSKTLGNSLDTGAQQHYELEAQKEVFYVLFFFLSQHSVIDTGDQIRRPTETRFAFTLGILCVLRVLPLFALSSLEGGEGDKHLCDPPSGAIIFRWERSGREKTISITILTVSEGHRNRDCSNLVHARRRRKRAQKKEAPFRQRRAAYRKTLLFLFCALCRKKRGGAGTQNACLLSPSLPLSL